MDYLDMLCESVDRAYDRFERLFCSDYPDKLGATPSDRHLGSLTPVIIYCLIMKHCYN